MKNFKDILYDKNDILIALAILIVAGLLIAWRMTAIMAYPETLAKESGTDDTTVSSAIDEPAQSADPGDSDEPAEPAAAATLWQNGALTREVTVTIQGGSATAAVQTLIDAELFESYDEFAEICSAAGCVPEDIKATTFTFATGSTRRDIATLVTQ